MLFRLLSLVHVCVAFPLKCPEPAQWSIRARSHCQNPSKYFCLKNDLINGFSENCTIIDFLQPGRKHVLRGGLDADICSSERFHPWPITFYTNVSTNCIFLKSKCNEEGQVLYGNGNRNTDATCRCDYTRGYDFLKKPRNPCFCIPSEEDCSCYLKKCPDSPFKLAPDYECSQIRRNTSMSQCRPIMNERVNSYENQSIIQYVPQENNVSTPVAWKTFAGLSTVCSIGLIIVVCISKYYRKVYFMDQPSDVEPLEGQSVHLKYKLLCYGFPMVFLKNDAVITKTSHIKEKRKGRSMVLHIDPVTANDEGEYCLKVACIKSNMTRMTIKPLFKRPLENISILEGSETIFECQTEEENSPIEWFHEGNKVTNNIQNVKMETLPGYIYKLTISQTGHSDGGKYHIKKNGVDCKANLVVKALFRRPLENVSILEGSETIFECQTEEENSPVEWFHEGNKVTNNTHNVKMETLPGYIYKLTIAQTSRSNGGKYNIKKNGVDCEAVLVVKALFRRPLENVSILEGSETIFECQTEEENNPVEWFHEGNKVTNETHNVKIETLPGYIYKLTISQTSRSDGGKYNIKKNGVDCEAILKVRALFRRPLKNVSILKGSKTILECQTEEENSPVEWFHEGNKVTNNIFNVTMETLPGYIYKLTISRTSISDGGKYNIKKNGVDCEAILNVREAVKVTYKTENIPDGEKFQMKTRGIDIEVLRDVEVRNDEELIKKISTLCLAIQSGEQNGKESCPLNIVVTINQIENFNVDDPVEFLNSQKDEINRKTECLEINLHYVIHGSVALCVDIPVEKIETDEMRRFVLYWFIQIILQTGVVHLSSTENLDVAVILFEDFNLEDAAIMENCSEHENNWQLGLPVEVNELDKKSAKEFDSLLKEEGYHHYEARVMLVGEPVTGKTTVARYLVGKGPTKARVSTDGLDLYNGWSFIDRETDEWLHGKQDFTLSEIAMSRCLWHEGDASTNFRENIKTVHQDTSEFPTENTLLVDDRSAYCNSHAPSMTTNQQCTLKESTPVNYASALVEKHSGDESLIISTDDSLPDNSDKIEKKYSKIDKDVKKSFTVSRINENKKPIESLSVFSAESIEENKKKKNTAISPFNVPCEPSTDRVEDDPIVPKKEIVKFPHEDKSSECSSTTEVVKDPSMIGKLKNLFGIQKQVEKVKVFMTKEIFLDESLKVKKKKLHHKKIAPVIILDFGRQDVFYSTHQTFLTYRAIYLIVVDGSRNLDDPCPFEQYLHGKSGTKTARDYLKFWINTIVTYCKGSRPGFPKIIIVLTHKDKVKTVEVESRRQQIFHDIEDMFSGSPLLSHLVIEDRIFVNAKKESDPEMSRIKKNIIEQAMKQPTWSQKLPKCFIPLELEFDSLLKRNIPLITMDHMKTINSVNPVRSLTEYELQVFLKFQHAVGRILYFEEEAHLNQHIILAPTHLIDAFKSIITDSMFCKGDRLRGESWDLMSQKGVIGKKSIEEIWNKNKYKKFQEHKEYLLGVMSHLDILVEPNRYDKSHKRIPAEFYYVASMVRIKNTTGYLESPNFARRNIGIAFSSSSSMIPPALSFRFVSYCLSLFAIKKYEQDNDMLFHKSAVFTIDSSLDMCVSCDDDIIYVRLVHSTNRSLIMRDLASSIRKCLADALEKISQLYVKKSSTGPLTDDDSFNLSLCCSSPVDPCLLPMFKLQKQDDSWICPKHGIEHPKYVLSSWSLQKEDIQCGVSCPVTDTDFLSQHLTDIHLCRLSVQYSINETKQLAIHLGMQYRTWEHLYETLHEEPEVLNFETLCRCIDGSNITFNEIRNAIEICIIQNPHTLCKVVRGHTIDFDQEPEKWDLVPSDEHFDKLAPLVGNNSLSFLVELGMKFATWEQIRFKQNDRDLVNLNRDILQEWKTTFCSLKTIRPSLRHIGQAFINIGKSIKSVENVLTDFF